jgi:mRNA interferase RelE/StbE
MRKLEKQDANRVDQCISGLADAPRAQGVIKLTNNDELYRARAGSYRIIFGIDDNIRTVAIARVRHRRDAY